MLSRQRRQDPHRSERQRAMRFALTRTGQRLTALEDQLRDLSAAHHRTWVLASGESTTDPTPMYNELRDLSGALVPLVAALGARLDDLSDAVHAREGRDEVAAAQLDSLRETVDTLSRTVAGLVAGSPVRR